MPTAPLTPGPDATPGSTAAVTPLPEPEPNAAPDVPRSEATRPIPGAGEREDATDQPPAPSSAPPPASSAPSPDAAAPTGTAGLRNATLLETEAQRLFGRPAARPGPPAGTRDNRPWEQSTTADSRGCTLPPADAADSTIPSGMAAISGRIFREDNGKPLAGARLQILGTPYGAFSDATGNYRLLFERSLVDRCRTQSVRVTAPGYRARDVILFVGAGAGGDVPLSRF